MSSKELKDMSSNELKDMSSKDLKDVSRLPETDFRRVMGSRVVVKTDSSQEMTSRRPSVSRMAGRTGPMMLTHHRRSSQLSPEGI